MDCKSESFGHPRTKKTHKNKNNELLNFFLFVIPLPPSRAAIFVCWMWAPGATTICWIRSSSPLLNVSLQQGLFWCKWRKICLWHGPFVWKTPLRAETDADSCLLCHSKWQFLSLTLSSSLSLLSLRVFTLNNCFFFPFHFLVSFEFLMGRGALLFLSIFWMSCVPANQEQTLGSFYVSMCASKWL